MAVIARTTGPLVLHLPSPYSRLPDADFLAFCRANPELHIEQSAAGELILMPPAGSETGRKNVELAISFGIWARADGSGVTFDSSAGFTLPNGARRSPDLSWVRRPRWEALSEAERNRLAPLCPDFVVELRSPSDSLEDLKEKLAEYIANGASLGWLIDPIERRVHVYQLGAPVVTLDDPATLIGDPVLPGFVLAMKDVWG
jgi:Uma2 family endonuclease